MEGIKPDWEDFANEQVQANKSRRLPGLRRGPRIGHLRHQTNVQDGAGQWLQNLQPLKYKNQSDRFFSQKACLKGILHVYIYLPAIELNV